jgi:hypothetical protein
MRVGCRSIPMSALVVTVLALGLLGIVPGGCGSTAASPTSVTSAVSASETTTTTVPSITAQPTTSIEYRNTQYGFSLSLPISWKGYSIVVDKWEGSSLDDNAAKVEGPTILIRHPQWTSEDPRQDIPIMIFTLVQWDLIQQEKLSVGAAPVGPSELGRSARYVFALPARYNFAFPTGYEEVEKILAGEPLQTF